MEEGRTMDDVFSLLSDCRISSSQESLLDDAPWTEPPLPTTTADAQGDPHEAQSQPPTTPDVVIIQSSPESHGGPHEAQSPPPTTPDVVIVLSSPESQGGGSQDAFHTAPEEPSAPSHDDHHQLQPEDDIDVTHCTVNRAAIDVEESDSSDEAREFMAPLFSEPGLHAAECRRLDDEELEVSEREVNKRMKFSDNNEGAETNFGGGGGEASDVVETRFVLVEPSDEVETRFVLVEPTDHVNCQASRTDVPGLHVLPKSFLENPRKEIKFPRDQEKKKGVAFDVLKALAEYDKDELCGMDLVEAAKRM